MSRRLLLSGLLVTGALLAAFAVVALWSLRSLRVEAEGQVRERLRADAARAHELAGRDFSAWLEEQLAADDAWRVTAAGDFLQPPEPVPFESGAVSPASPGEHAFYLREGERAEHADGDLAAAEGFYGLASAAAAPASVRRLALARAAALAAKRGNPEKSRRLWTLTAEIAGDSELLLIASAEGGNVPLDARLDSLVRHLDAHRDGRTEGYARRLGLADHEDVVARRRNLELMRLARPGAIPLPPDGEVRWRSLGSEWLIQRGTRLVVARESELRDLLGASARLPGEPPAAGLSSTLPGEGPLNGVRFVAIAGEGETDRIVRGQAVLLLGAMGLAAAAGIASLWILLRGVRREAELARLKSDFVANVSHDLRAPLSLIRVYAETMRNGRVPDGEESEYAGVVERESVALSQMVDRVLTFSRIERGTKEYRREPIDLVSFLREYVGEARRRWPELTIDVDVPNETRVARIDREAIAGALGNLLDNATRHTEGGEVLLRLGSSGDSHVRVEVLDRGPGLEAEEAMRVFERFYRGDAALKRASRGSGLGLTLVRHAARGHGGEAGYEPREGGGAVFFIRLPVEP